MGKTVFVRSLLRGRDRVIVLDPCLEYEADHYDDLGELVESLERRPETFRVRTQWPKDLPVLCAVANSMGSTTLVIEEAQASIPPSNEPLPAALENVIYRGRHFVTEGRDLGTSLILVAQRAATIHIAARSQWTRLVTFNQSEKADVQWLEGQLGIDRDVFARLPELHGLMATRDRVVTFKLDIGREGYARIEPIRERRLIPASDDDNEDE